MPSASTRTGNTKKIPARTEALVRKAAAAATGLLDQRQPLCAIGGDGHAVPVAFKRAGGESADGLIVLDDQKLCHGRHIWR